jgi:hypothetical protein
VFQCAATTQFTQSSYQTKKNIFFPPHSVSCNRSRFQWKPEFSTWISMKCKFFLHHSLLCIEFVSMTSLSSFRSSFKTFCLFQEWFALHFKIAAALSSANCAVPPGTFLTTLYFRFWASNLPLPFYSCLKIQFPSVLLLLCTSCLEEMIRGTYSSAHIISPQVQSFLKRKTSNESVSSPIEEYCEIVHLKADS